MTIDRAVVPGSLVLDATVGNGHDTVLLAEAVGEAGIVVGLDVQESALKIAEDRLAKRGLQSRVRLFRRGHENVSEVLAPFLDRRLTAATYNLGYLPGSDRTVITRPETTIGSLEQVVEMLATGGVITVVAYRGHPGGIEETGAVEDWCRCLPTREFVVSCYSTINQGQNTPRLLAVVKS